MCYPFAPPFTPENYIKAIEVCEKAGIEVIIIDSISHEWDELLDFHSKLAGNSFTNWAKVTPRQKAFVDKILQTNAHIIATMRTKQDYVLNQKRWQVYSRESRLKISPKGWIGLRIYFGMPISQHWERQSTPASRCPLPTRASQLRRTTLNDYCNPMARAGKLAQMLFSNRLKRSAIGSIRYGRNMPPFPNFRCKAYCRMDRS